MRIAIIGGGAAGMMCAAAINEQNPKAEVFLIEKNDSLGKKVIISGGGRCNLTTGIEDVKIVLNNYPRGNKFLNSAMRHFPPSAVRQWFEEHGVPVKIEVDNRVFPVSNKGKDVVSAFEKIFADNNTKVLINHSVQTIKKEGNRFTVSFTNQPALVADKVVFTLGGQAYRQTGSSGDGYSLAESLGHHITELASSLSSLTSKESWPAQVAGISFIKSVVQAQGKKKYETAGPFVFTHWGLSGPAIFALSSLVAFEKISTTEPLKIFIDLVPDSTLEQVLLKIKNSMETEPKKLFKYSLRQIAPLSLADIAIDQIGIRQDKKNIEINKQELRESAEWFKHLPLTIIDRHPGDEFVTAGGVDLSEVNPSTMESKICPGLYFAGEILDIDGFTGGFNLQAAWAAGHLAGTHACID
jgi:predicted Rossmann fold flavoprotein